MYDKYFGLTDKPFSIAPDPRFLFMSEQHREALAHLVYGVGDGGGFVLLTGEVGTGKTTVCRCLLEQLPEKTRIAFILNPKLSTTELLANVCDELSIKYPDEPSLKQLTDALNEFLLSSHAAGLKIVLMIDEAQNLSVEVLEQIRLLTNLETNKEKLLQIILIGQPELKVLLAEHDLRQLAQRITARYHLRPLTIEECESYVLHRLEVSGFSDSLFDKNAMKELFRRTGGIPRLINVICDRSMLGAYAKNRRQIGAKVIKQAASEVMGGEIHVVQADTIKPVHIPGYKANLVLYGLGALVVIISSYVFYLLNQQGVQKKQSDEQTQIQNRQVTELEKLAAENKLLKDAVKQAAAEKILIPESVLPFLSAEVQPTSRLQALQQLMQLWGVEYIPERDGDACEFAEINQLRCETESGDWQNLSKINRPVVMKLVSTSGLPIYGVLIAINGINVQMNFSGKEYRFKKNQISAYWEGEYSLIWQMPANYQQPLSISMRGRPVQWLKTSLASLENIDLIVPPNAIYDDNLKVQVELFQQQHSLKSDGVAGHLTLITLNGIINNTPTLLAVGVN